MRLVTRGGRERQKRSGGNRIGSGTKGVDDELEMQNHVLVSRGY